MTQKEILIKQLAAENSAPRESQKKLREWTIIANSEVFEGDDGGPDPYTAGYEAQEYCEKHPDATEADIERIAAFYDCHVKWHGMKRLTTDTPKGNLETMLNFVYGKDGWAYIRHDGENADIPLTAWASNQCARHGCGELARATPEEIDQILCDCMMGRPVCPVAMAYCFASQAVHLRSRLKLYEDTGLSPEDVSKLNTISREG